MIPDDALAGYVIEEWMGEALGWMRPPPSAPGAGGVHTTFAAARSVVALLLLDGGQKLYRVRPISIGECKRPLRSAN